MNKMIFYSRTAKVKQMLDESFPQFEGRYKVKIAAKTFHGKDRLDERSLSKEQERVLMQIALKRVAFKLEQVSEVRVINVNGKNFPISVVVDDVVIGVHPKNLPLELHRQGYGTEEGEGFGVIKTVLSRPNKRPNVPFVENFKVCA